MPFEVSDIYNGAPLGMVLFGPRGEYLRVNARLAEFNGTSVEAHAGKTIADIIPDIAPRVQALIDEVMATAQPIRRALFEWERAGEHRTYAVDWYPVFDGDGHVRAVGAIADDVTEAQAREQMIVHVARELQHRVKNTLANVMALVEQAQRALGPKEEVLGNLKARLNALSKTHSRLTEANWGPIALYGLLDQELTQLYGAAVQLSGPDMHLMAQPALAFSMALHEMAANAARFGALSAAGGTVSLNWTVEQDATGGHIAFSWVERGGPPMPPDCPSGFGNRLIEASLRTSLRGEMRRIVGEKGLEIHFRLPLALMTGQTAVEPQPA